MSKDTRLAWLFNCAAAVLMLILPMLIYLKHQGYPLVRPEILMIFAGLIAVGLVLGVAMSLGRTAGLVVVSTVLLVLILDIQTNWWVHFPRRVVVLMIAIAALTWLVRRYLSRLLTLIFGVMLLSTLILPGGHPFVRLGDSDGPNQAAVDLPLLLHIILDEHIGIEGIPREFDPQGELAGRLRDFYLDNSFQVFGRAYSRYYDTYDSVANLLNFANTNFSSAFYGGESGRGRTLRKNAWFDHLHRQGYRIHVVQSGYLRYFKWNEQGGIPSGNTGLEYDAEAILPLTNTTLTAKERIPFILGTYIKLSHYLKTAGGVYRRAYASEIGTRLHLPDLGQLDRTQTTPLSSREMLSELKNQLATAHPGQAIFAHIMLPHYPFAFAADCSLEPKARLWFQGQDALLSPYRNDPASRRLRYPRYLGQVLCVQDLLDEMFRVLHDRGLWEETIVIVHGDHGSRICHVEPKGHILDQMSDYDYVDSFSTLFAVKQPGIPGGYFDEQLPIDHLFRRLLVDGIEPGDTKLENSPFVFIRGTDEFLSRQPMPAFAHGTVQ